MPTHISTKHTNYQWGPAAGGEALRIRPISQRLTQAVLNHRARTLQSRGLTRPLTPASTLPPSAAELAVARRGHSFFEHFSRLRGRDWGQNCTEIDGTTGVASI